MLEKLCTDMEGKAGSPVAWEHSNLLQ